MEWIEASLLTCLYLRPSILFFIDLKSFIICSCSTLSYAYDLSIWRVIYSKSFILVFIRLIVLFVCSVFCSLVLLLLLQLQRQIGGEKGGGSLKKIISNIILRPKDIKKRMRVIF